MKHVIFCGACLLVLASIAAAAPRSHVVGLGKWTTVKSVAGDDESKAVDLRVRPLLVDGRVKELVVGAIHEITDRTFVAQRIFRLNDSLPQESGAPRWRWELGGWMLVDRTTGRTQAIALPGFDSYRSSASWFRDYAAYCGASEDASKIYAVVFQVGKRKPLLKKVVGENQGVETSPCIAPVWDRAPARVTFQLQDGQKFVYSIRNRSVELVVAETEDADD